MWQHVRHREKSQLVDYLNKNTGRKNKTAQRLVKQQCLKRKPQENSLTGAISRFGCILSNEQMVGTRQKTPTTREARVIQRPKDIYPV
jgi:hypothetical protein